MALQIRRVSDWRRALAVSLAVLALIAAALAVQMDLRRPTGHLARHVPSALGANFDTGVRTAIVERRQP